MKICGDFSLQANRDNMPSSRKKQKASNMTPTDPSVSTYEEHGPKMFWRSVSQDDYEMMITELMLHCVNYCLFKYDFPDPPSGIGWLFFLLLKPLLWILPFLRPRRHITVYQFDKAVDRLLYQDQFEDREWGLYDVLDVNGRGGACFVRRVFHSEWPKMQGNINQHIKNYPNVIFCTPRVDWMRQVVQDVLYRRQEIESQLVAARESIEKLKWQGKHDRRSNAVLREELLEQENILKRAVCDKTKAEAACEIAQKQSQMTINATSVQPTTGCTSMPPDSIECPLTLDLMKDPVICSDGHTYERSAISKWLKKHNTSPVTNKPLKSVNLIPNRALKKVIEEWKSMQR